MFTVWGSSTAGLEKWREQGEVGSSPWVVWVRPGVSSDLCSHLLVRTGLLTPDTTDPLQLEDSVL